MPPGLGDERCGNVRKKWNVYKLFTQMCQISLAFLVDVGYDVLALRAKEC